MGIDSKLFGPSLWGAIHYIALGSPDVFDTTAKNVYNNFYSSLPQLIPCNSCAQHFQELLNTIPINNYLYGSSSLFEWTVIVHNAVNRKINKPELSVNNAKNIWMASSNINIANNTNTTNTIVLDKNNITHASINIYDVIIKCILVILAFGSGVYIGKLLFTMQRKK